MSSIIRPDISLKYDESVAQEWSRINPQLENPVRNLGVDYLKFVNTTCFSEEARHFLKHGYYTAAPYGSRDYNEYWDIQEDRVLNGYSVGGVRIPGRYYYFLNFCKMKARPIDLVTGLESRSRKIITFPRFLDHQYYFFLVLEECFAEGPHVGKNMQGLCIFKSRRKGFTYVIAGGVYNYNFNFVPASMNVLAAYQKDFFKVTLDGIHFTLNHVNKATDWAKRRDKLDQRDHFRASYVAKNDLGMDVEDGYMSEIHAISFKDDPFKSIGECLAKGTGVLMYDGTFKKVEDIKIGDLLMGIDSTPRRVLGTHSGIDELYEITPTKGKPYTTNGKHNNLIFNQFTDKGYKIIRTSDLLNRLSYHKVNQKLEFCGSIDFSDKTLLIDPYIFGIWLGDGTSANFSITTMDKEVVDSIKEYVDRFDGASIYTINKPNCKAKTYRIGSKQKYSYLVTKNGITQMFDSQREIADVLNIDASNLNESIKENRLCKGYLIRREKYVSPFDLLKRLKVLNNKHIPQEYLINSEKNRLELLAGIIDTDGNLTNNGTYYEISQKRKEIVDQIIFLAQSLGFVTNCERKEKQIGSKLCTYYRILLTGDIYRIPVRIQRKKSEKKDSRVHSRRRTTFSIKQVGKGEFFGFELDGDKLFIMDNFIVTHNSTFTLGFEEAGQFPGMLSALTIAEPTYRDGDIMTGVPIIWGSAGNKGAVLDLEEVFYHPEAYGLKTFENVYDENAVGNCGFFIDDMWYYPGKETKDSTQYMVDTQGNSDRQSAERSLDAKREVKKKGNKDAYNLFITQQPKRPSEGFLRAEGTIFDTVTTKGVLANILTNPRRYQDSILRVQMEIRNGGSVSWSPSMNQPIVEFPLKDNKNKPGVIEIYSPPVKDNTGFIQPLRYIAGIDSYDDDASETVSVGSCIVFDRFRDMIVAWYKARPDTRHFYEQCRRLLMYYNATANYERRNKGIYGHFFNKNSLHMLCDEPDILRDKGISKANLMGNNLKGTYPSIPVKNYGNSLMVAYLEASVYGEDPDKGITNYYTIRSIGLLREMIYWSPDPRKNFDDVDAFRMLMIYRESLLKYEIREQTRAKDALNDPFWDRHKRQAMLRKDPRIISSSDFGKKRAIGDVRRRLSS